MNVDRISDCWRNRLAADFGSDDFAQLAQFVAAERDTHEVFPAADDVFSAFEMTPWDQVRVVILGQDPYHDDGQAHGLSFSVQPGIKIPASLRNIYKELHTDLNIEPASHGCLESWARQGVLLLNTVLTVRAHEANSHRKKGWERLTDRVIECVNDKPNVAFVLWGKPAQTKKKLIDDRHFIVESAHPSPLSAYRGFFESRPFSQINSFLEDNNLTPIDWRLE